MGHQKSVIFPVKGNSHLIDEVAKKFIIEVYPKKNIILFSGDLHSINELKSLLNGGITA